MRPERVDREALRIITEEFGVPGEVARAYAYVARGDGVWAVPRGVDVSPLSGLGRLLRIGVRVFRWSGEGLRPTNNLAYLFDRHVRKRVAEVGAKVARALAEKGYARVGDLGVEEGFVVVRFRGRAICIAKYGRGFLRADMPAAVARALASSTA